MHSSPLEFMLPVVLAGGVSRRFGRNKLLEPWADGVLIQRPIAVLREVFGSRVALVGTTDPSLAALADHAIPDAFPGAGPLGGILSALAAHPGAIFVLAGDMPGFGVANVHDIINAAGDAPGVLAVLARGDRLNPCAGMYRPAARSHLEAHLQAGRASLHDALPQAGIIEVPVLEAALRNINVKSDL